MSKEVSVEAETVQEALEEAARQLEVTPEELAYELLCEPEKRTFGKNRNAEIRAWVDSEADKEEALDTPAEMQDEEVAAPSEGVVASEGETKAEGEGAPYCPSRDDMTEEELDEVADTAIDILRSILVFFDAEEATIDEYEGDDGEIILDVVGEDLAVLIGRHGRTLDALQTLVVTSMNRVLGYRYPVVVDVEGYRGRQRQKIEGLARSAAARAAKQGGSVKLRPMTPYERRIVHITLRDDARVITGSEGKEPGRQVVVTAV